MSLIGKVLLGNVFVQDPNPLFVKINNVGIGESIYGYKTITDKDIGHLLENCVKDPKIVCIVYNWTTNIAYIKSGFNLNNSKDYKLAEGFTTFVVKSNISKYYPTPGPGPVPVPVPVPVPGSVFIAPYCMPGSDTMRAAIAAVKPYPINFTLAFWNNGNWDSGNPDSTLISDIRNNGGDICISFGGASGCENNQEPALLGGTVQQVMQRYLVPIKQYNCKYIDLDIEGGKESDTNSYQLRNSALVLVQQQVPNLKISFTIAADQNGIYSQNMLKDAIGKGIRIDTIRLMLMDFGSSMNLVSACISGLQKSYSQLSSIGQFKIGFIPLLLKDDQGINTYTLQNHKDILSQIKTNKMTYVQCFSYWELAIDQGQNFNFLKSYISSLPTSVPGPVPAPAPVPSSQFVIWDSKLHQFTCNSKKFVPVGFNCFGLGLCQEYMNYYSHQQITELFENIKSLSGTCIRSHTLGFSSSSNNSLLDDNLNFRDKAWDPIDFSLSEAKRLGIKVMPILTDPYEYYHGSYKAFCTNGVPKEQFFTDPTARNNFKKFISGWLNHTNKYTGIINKNCSDIFALELGNELGQQREDSGSTAIPTQDWLSDISNFIKSIAPNILVLCPTDESLGQSNEFNIKNLDIYSQHFYGYDYDRMSYGYNNSKNVNKTYIIGEYSSQFGQDWFNHIENLGIYGSFAWSLYPHNSDGSRLVHGDNFDTWYDNQTQQNTQQLLLISNHFRRMQGLQTITQLPF